MIGLVGLDHHWAPAEVRARLSFTDVRHMAALRALAETASIDEVVLLSTCNRTEVYIATGDWPLARSAVERFFAASFAHGTAADPTATLTGACERSGAHQPTSTTSDTMPTVPTGSGGDGAGAPEPRRYLYADDGAEAARHLFRVAAGLRSMLVGEAQILGQVKDAMLAAEQATTIGEQLRPLFAQAIKVGKRARSDTRLGQVDRSLASAAVQLASESLGGLRGKSALLIGAGVTSQLCAQHLRTAGVKRLVLANRTEKPAADLAASVGGETVALDDVCDVIDEMDLIISATAAPHMVLNAATVACGLRGRRTPLVIVDLALPADVDPAAGLLPQVSLHTIDQLRDVAAIGSAQAADLEQVERIVDEGVAVWAHERQVRHAVPGIAALRRHVDHAEQVERERMLAELAHLSEADQRIVARYGQRLVDKMFHYLVIRIRALAEYDEVPPEVTMRVLEQLFADPDDQQA